MEIGVDRLDEFGDAMHSRRDTERREQENKILLVAFWICYGSAKILGLVPMDFIVMIS